MYPISAPRPFRSSSRTTCSNWDLSPVVHDITDRLRGVGAPDGYTLHVTGVPFVRTEVVDMMVSDEVTFMPLVTLVFLVTICPL